MLTNFSDTAAEHLLGADLLAAEIAPHRLLAAVVAPAVGVSDSVAPVAERHPADPLPPPATTNRRAIAALGEPLRRCRERGMGKLGAEGEKWARSPKFEQRWLCIFLTRKTTNPITDMWDPRREATVASQVAHVPTRTNKHLKRLRWPRDRPLGASFWHARANKISGYINMHVLFKDYQHLVVIERNISITKDQVFSLR
jgi:hypothetical protein